MIHRLAWIAQIVGGAWDHEIPNLRRTREFITFSLSITLTLLSVKLLQLNDLFSSTFLTLKELGKDSVFLICKRLCGSRGTFESQLRAFVFHLRVELLHMEDVFSVLLLNLMSEAKAKWLLLLRFEWIFYQCTSLEKLLRLWDILEVAIAMVHNVFLIHCVCWANNKISLFRSLFRHCINHRNWSHQKYLTVPLAIINSLVNFVDVNFAQRSWNLLNERVYRRGWRGRINEKGRLTIFWSDLHFFERLCLELDKLLLLQNMLLRESQTICIVPWRRCTASRFGRRRDTFLTRGSFFVRCGALVIATTRKTTLRSKGCSWRTASLQFRRS